MLQVWRCMWWGVVLSIQVAFYACITCSLGAVLSLFF